MTKVTHKLSDSNTVIVCKLNKHSVSQCASDYGWHNWLLGYIYKNWQVSTIMSKDHKIKSTVDYLGTQNGKCTITAEKRQKALANRNSWEIKSLAVLLSQYKIRQG